MIKYLATFFVLLSCGATAQTIKSLGYNTNGQIVYSGGSTLTFTNSLQFATNAAATTRTNLGLGTTNTVSFKAVEAAQSVLGSLATNTTIDDLSGFQFRNIGGNSVNDAAWYARYPGTATVAFAMGQPSKDIMILQPSQITFTTNVFMKGALSFEAVDPGLGQYNDYAAMTRTNLGLGTAATSASTDFQPASANLTNLASNNAINLTNFPALARTNLSLGWLALTNPQSSLYSGTATKLLGYVAETNPSGSGLTGFNVMAYTNTNTLVIPANLLIGGDAVPAARNPRNVTVQGAVTIQYPYSSLTTIYGNNSITATDASTYTNTLATWNSNTVTFATNVSVAGALGVSNAATFATNVTIVGNLTAKSLVTSDPVNIILDATQTSASTNGVLTLPDNANLIRLTNNNAISAVTNGRLGSFYYLVNQVTNGATVTISNVGGITIDGAANLTLSPNESATLVALGPTNISVAARSDLNDVTLGGTANIAPQQTNASSASSLMTRGLSDDRYLGEMWHAWRMSAYSTTNIPVSVFRTAPCVLYTNGQSGFYVEAFLDPSKYAGKTLQVVAYCRVDTTNGGVVAGIGKAQWLTNIVGGGADPNFPFTVGGASHGSFGGSFTNFPIDASTNQYVVLRSPVGTVATNAKMIMVAFGFDRSSTNTTFTNGNLYLQAVQVVVEP